jgi:hypothetical protein
LGLESPNNNKYKKLKKNGGGEEPEQDKGEEGMRASRV